MLPIFFRKSCTVTRFDVALIKRSCLDSSSTCTVNLHPVLTRELLLRQWLLPIVVVIHIVVKVGLIRIETVSSVVQATVGTRGEIYRCSVIIAKRLATAPDPPVMLLGLAWVAICRVVVRVKQDQFLIIVRYGQRSSELLNVVVELGEDVAGTLFRDLQDQTLRLLNVKRRDIHQGMTRTYLYDVVAFAHALAFLVEDNSVLVEYASLAIDYSSRLCKLPRCRPGTPNQTT